jgi:CheY-like chemotaxis protein
VSKVGSLSAKTTFRHSDPQPEDSLRDFHYRILVVDDDERIRRLSEDVFSHFGYEVRTAIDGFDALALMRSALPELIICDLKMPGMSGFEFLSVVRRRFPQIPVICISGEFVGTQGPEGLLCDAFFQKGQYQPEKLLNKIRWLLTEGGIRPPIPKPGNAPVWVPCTGDHYVLNCTECLRSVSIPKDQPCNIARQMPCIFCGAPILFILEPEPYIPAVPAKPPQRAGEHRADRFDEKQG